MIQNLQQYTPKKHHISNEGIDSLKNNSMYEDYCKRIFKIYNIKNGIIENTQVISTLVSNTYIEPLLSELGIENIIQYKYDEYEYFAFNENFVCLQTQINQMMLISKYETYVFAIGDFPNVEIYDTNFIMSFVLNWERFLNEFDTSSPNVPSLS